MPPPNVKLNINNVSMDYFLRGVDAGYPQYRTGAVTFTFDKARSERFQKSLRELAGQIDRMNAEYVRDAELIG